VPSKWSKDALKRGGVKIPIHVVGHGVPSRWLKPLKFGITTFRARALLRYPRPRLLFFCARLDWRKGVDIVRDACKILVKRGFEFTLILKTVEIKADWVEKYHIFYFGIPHVLIHAFLSQKELRDLYEACDIVLHPSRGGAFELNALEAICLGKPVLYTHQLGCFDYLMGYGVPVKSERINKIDFIPERHVAYGYEVDSKELADKIITVWENYQEMVGLAKSFPKREWTWQAVGKQFLKVIEKYWG